MNRNQEYFDLLTNLKSTPEELEYTLTRAKAKQKKQHRFFAIPLSSFASFFVIFITLVNCSATFAYGCGRIPLIKELAKLVAFSPSLSAAVENEYVQPIEIEQSQNGITARVEYVIVDQKQLDVFYTLDAKKYKNMDATLEIYHEDGSALDGYSLFSNSFDTPNGELRHATIDFMEKDMPNKMQFVLKVNNNDVIIDQPVEEINAEDSDEEEVYTQPDYISSFHFLLSFDPYYTAQGETIALNKTFFIDGQTLTATTAEIYPTHIRLNFADHEENTAWLKSLKFYLQNEKGQRYEAISNGITATGCEDSPMMASHRLESSFFSECKHLTLYITEVTWLDKDMERVKVDLKNKTIENLPETVRLDDITNKKNDWTLRFSAEEYKDHSLYQMWNWDYYDPEGNPYRLYSVSSCMSRYEDKKSEGYINTPNRFCEEFTLKNYPFDEVFLSASYSRVVKLPKVIELKVK